MTRKQHLSEIAEKLRESHEGDIEKIISQIAIALHYINAVPKTKKGPETIYVLTVTQKVMETYIKMRSKPNGLNTDTLLNFKKHLEKAALQLEIFTDGLTEDPIENS